MNKVSLEYVTQVHIMNAHSKIALTSGLQISTYNSHTILGSMDYHQDTTAEDEDGSDSGTYVNRARQFMIVH